MQGQKKQSSDVVAPIITIKHCYLHSFQNGLKHPLNQGTLKIFQTTDEEKTATKMYYMNINTYYHYFNNSKLLYTYEYPKSMSYLFENQNKSINCLSISKKSEGLHNFIELLKINNFMVNLLSDEVDPIIKSKIIQSYPKLQQQQIYPQSKVKGVLKSIGSFFASIDKATKGFTDKIQNKYQQTLTKLSQKPFSQKLKVIKDKASLINDKMSEYVKPINKMSSQLVTTVNNKLQKSQNSFVKYMKNVSTITAESLNEGYNGKISSKSTTMPEQQLKEDQSSNIQFSVGQKLDKKSNQQ